ncbi:hypothetical protein GCM10009660_13040 [Catellatospora bangladeshensis]
MWGCGSMTVTDASPERSFFCNPSAVYMPTYPPPTITIRVGCDFTAAIRLWSHRTRVSDGFAGPVVTTVAG